MYSEQPYTKSRILILTDDVDASRAWFHILNRHDIEAEVAGYERLVDIIDRINSFHEILVDHYGDPDSARQICRKIRNLFQQPLLLFTYETAERYFLDMYQLGVEECVAKPIGIPLFVAKSRAWLRQTIQYDIVDKKLTVEGFTLDSETKILATSEVSVKLSNLECRLMAVLMANRGQVVEATLLARRVWSADVNPQMLKHLIYRLRHKIARVSDGRQYIQSIAGIGYQFNTESQPS